MHLTRVRAYEDSIIVKKEVLESNIDSKVPVVWLVLISLEKTDMAESIKSIDTRLRKK